MKIKFIIASEFPMITLGLFSWRYSEDDGDIDKSGITIALGFIFFHVGISIYQNKIWN